MTAEKEQWDAVQLNALEDRLHSRLMSHPDFKERILNTSSPESVYLEILSHVRDWKNPDNPYHADMKAALGSSDRKR